MDQASVDLIEQRLDIACSHPVEFKSPLFEAIFVEKSGTDKNGNPNVTLQPRDEFHVWAEKALKGSMEGYDKRFLVRGDRIGERTERGTYKLKRMRLYFFDDVDLILFKMRWM